MIKAQALERGINATMSPAIFVDEISYKGLSPYTVGLCINSGRGKRVEVLRSFWETADYDTKLSLMLHEQGHCAFGLSHMIDTIMNPSLVFPTEELIEEYWELVTSKYRFAKSLRN